jgi:hypothetical protein
MTMSGRNAARTSAATNVNMPLHRGLSMRERVRNEQVDPVTAKRIGGKPPSRNRE